MKPRWNRIAIGIGFCPFWWQFGDISLGHWEAQRMYAFGPFRLSLRGWR